MKDVGRITRVMHDKRVMSLMNFRRRLADNQAASLFFLLLFVVSFIMLLF